MGGLFLAVHFARGIGERAGFCTLRDVMKCDTAKAFNVWITADLEKFVSCAAQIPLLVRRFSVGPDIRWK
ncbi:MAG: hypothetical protein DI585_01720 [Pseudomonas fluorescens]|nr:MAG: hypothetical protein DI585_01720 [Pseudomonas fluorescens]